MRRCQNVSSAIAKNCDSDSFRVKNELKVSLDILCAASFIIFVIINIFACKEVMEKIKSRPLTIQ